MRTLQVPYEESATRRTDTEVLIRLVEEKLQPRLEKKQAWTQEHQQALQRLKQKHQALIEQH